MKEYYFIRFRSLTVYLYYDRRANVRFSVKLQMQCKAAKMLIRFSLCSVTAIEAIDCRSYVPTFGLVIIVFNLATSLFNMI